MKRLMPVGSKLLIEKREKKVEQGRLVLNTGKQYQYFLADSGPDVYEEFRDYLWMEVYLSLPWNQEILCGDEIYIIVEKSDILCFVREEE